MANVLPPFPSFSVHEDKVSVGPWWKKWLKRFKIYLAAHDVKDATRKRALLLYSAGEEVSDIFETLPDQGEEKDYVKAVTALNRLFTVPYFSMRSYMLIVEFHRPPSRSLDASETGESTKCPWVVAVGFIT